MAGPLDFVPTLCLYGKGKKKKKKKADHKTGMRFNVYQGRWMPAWYSAAFCFQMKMLCAVEELE